MLILMMGLPGSGKSTIVGMLSKFVNINSVCPEDLYPDNFNELKYEEQHAIKLAAWHTSIDYIKDNISKDALLLLDSCNANLDLISELMALAKSHNQKTAAIFTAASDETCIRRLNKENKLVNNGLYSKYRTRFVGILSTVVFDKFYKINTEDKKDIVSKLRKILDMIGSEIACLDSK